MSETDLEMASRLIRGRRTWKPENMDGGREVPQELLETMFENANWAPTHGLTEPWRFRVFRGEARGELAGVLQRLYSDYTPEGAFREDKLAKLGRTPLLAPVVIAIGMTREVGGKIPEIEEVAAVACAVQNMHLTAAAAGLAAKWSSPPVCYLPEMGEYLGLGEAGKCLGFFYVGWPKEGVSAPVSVRRSVGEKVEENLR